MDKLDMFQSVFGKIDKFGWRDLERFLEDAEKKFTLKDFKEDFQICRVHWSLAPPGRQ